jgi:hypothetical protein
VKHITTDSSVDTLIDVIQMFRDKEEVLNYAALILKRIVWSDEKYLVSQQVLSRHNISLSYVNHVVLSICFLSQSQCRMKENIKRILGIYKLLKMEQKESSVNKDTEGKQQQERGGQLSTGITRNDPGKNGIRILSRILEKCIAEKC